MKAFQPSPAQPGPQCVDVTVSPPSGKKGTQHQKTKGPRFNLR